jgi:hypothetical protein
MQARLGQREEAENRRGPEPDEQCPLVPAIRALPVAERIRQHDEEQVGAPGNEPQELDQEEHRQRQRDVVDN